MHIFFSGIGGTGIGPLALIAHKAGYQVSGSDKQDSGYISYLKDQGIADIQIGQSEQEISNLNKLNPIDWYVYSSALPKENPKHPELLFVQNNKIKHSKRDEFLNYILNDKKLKLLALSGTHGKTTTTAMMIWLFKQLRIPVSYSVGAKIKFGEMGEYNSNSQYFIYECDEYDRNFLSFTPYLSLITGIDWDHADIYPTREDYYLAFKEFISKSGGTMIWQDDYNRLGLTQADTIMTLKQDDLPNDLMLPGIVNKQDAWLVIQAVHQIFQKPLAQLIDIMNRFPGVSRRFEPLQDGLYTDYAHTPAKIKGALQIAHETAGQNVVVVYEGLHNTRQHFIKNDLLHLFDSVKKLYVVPSYLAREDESLSLLSTQDIVNLTSKPFDGVASLLNDELSSAIKTELSNGNLVLCLSAGGGNSLDEWLRTEFK